MPIAELLIDAIQKRGPLTVAAFMDLALYDPEFGYYARAVLRSGRSGDFFTSVDVGAMFGDLLEIQVAEMAEILATLPATPPPSENAGHAPKPPAPSAVNVFHLVEAGAGSGRLSADILRAARGRHPGLFARTRLHLVETGAAARGAQPAILGEVADRLASSAGTLPTSFEGVLLANELLDALPVHQVVMRQGGLREVYVDVAGDPGNGDPEHLGFVTREGPLSTPRLAEYLQRLEVVLDPGWRVEINLRAVDWIREAAQRLRRGFIVLIDYGHEALELYSATHAGGTLTTFARHTMAGSESAFPAPWLNRPGDQDISAHVDFTTVRRVAEAEGLSTLGFLDQTYFLMGLLGPNPENPPTGESAPTFVRLEDRLALKTLLMPGGLGSTLKVMIFGKGVGVPALRGCGYRMRVT